LQQRLDEVRSISEGETTVEDIVAGENPGADPRTLRKAQATRNQHHSRARASVHARLDNEGPEARVKLARAVFDMLFRVRRKIT